jgi:hypothetical protein
MPFRVVGTPVVIQTGMGGAFQVVVEKLFQLYAQVFGVGSS